nr:MAG TPA: hypothetical protein [Caudoviricetes sp.]
MKIIKVSDLPQKATLDADDKIVGYSEKTGGTSLLLGQSFKDIQTAVEASVSAAASSASAAAKSQSATERIANDAKSALTAQKADALDAINSAKTTGVSAVLSAQKTAESSINSASSSATSAIARDKKAALTEMNTVKASVAGSMETAKAQADLATQKASAAATSATNAASSEYSAKGSASTATTKASEASASAAAAASSASAAASSQRAAASSASDAAESAATVDAKGEEQKTRVTKEGDKQVRRLQAAQSAAEDARDLARAWAVRTDSPVENDGENEYYGAKYYADAAHKATTDTVSRIEELKEEGAKQIAAVVSEGSSQKLELDAYTTERKADLDEVASTYYYPTLSEEGDISWTNTGGRPNPETVNIRGPRGFTGSGLKPLGQVADHAALLSAHPTGSAGDAWQTQDDAHIWVWDIDQLKWVDYGLLKGMPGASANEILMTPDPVAYFYEIYGQTHGDIIGQFVASQAPLKTDPTVVFETALI